MQKFKIKSLTDVITNSSTEVFTIYKLSIKSKRWLTPYLH